MLEQTVTLTCKFKDTKNESRSILINNPKEDVDTEKMTEFMNYVIDSEVLILDEKDPELKYASVAGASLTMKTVEELELA